MQIELTKKRSQWIRVIPKSKMTIVLEEGYMDIRESYIMTQTKSGWQHGKARTAKNLWLPSAAKRVQEVFYSVSEGIWFC